MSTSPSSSSTCAPLAADAPQIDHRVRTGALRRERTRRKLLGAAMAVFAEKGVEAPVIEDFIAAAGVARGTFYNYFNTTQELLDAVTSDLSDEILACIDKVVLRIDDPLQRLTCGCLLYMHFGVDLPNWGAFIMRTGLRGNTIGKLVDTYLPRDLELAHQAGQVEYETVRSARDLILACVSRAIQAVNTGDAPREHLRQMFALALRGLGVPLPKANELSRMPLPEAPLPAVFEDGV